MFDIGNNWEEDQLRVNKRYAKARDAYLGQQNRRHRYFRWYRLISGYQRWESS